MLSRSVQASVDPLFSSSYDFLLRLLLRRERNRRAYYEILKTAIVSKLDVAFSYPHQRIAVLSHPYQDQVFSIT